MTPPFVGQLPLDIARVAVDKIVTVTERELVETMKLFFVRCKLVTEASGAAATAALIHGKINLPPGARVVTVVSGGNIDPAKLCEAFNV